MKSLNYNKVFISKKYFMIPKHVHVIIDRQLGTYHPKHKNIFYSLNYGYVEGVMGGDGEEQDVYVMGVDEPLETFDGDVIAVIHRTNDVEDKRVAAPKGMNFSVEEIREQTAFQEQFFESEIELVDQCLVVNFNEGKKISNFGDEMGKSHSSLKLILTVIFIVTLLVSNVITGRQIQLPFGIVMTGAIIIFPITYILSDVFSEVYGYKWSRITCYLGFACNLFMSLTFLAVINMKAPEYFENASAYSIALGNTWRVLISSLVAYVIGDFANDKIFQKMKSKHPDDNKGFGRRAIISSLVGETVDSGIFIPLAFIGAMPTKVLVTMIVTQVIFKVVYEVIVLPITIFVTKKAQSYENSLNVDK